VVEKASGNILILHEINNPLNLGALARSAQWFGFETIMLSSHSVDYTHPKAIRASMGSLFHLTILSDVDLKSTLPEIKKIFFLVGSDVHEGLRPHPVPEKVALLLGNESHGLPENILQMTDEKWRIPGSGKADSLSLPQAAAIMMYECTKNKNDLGKRPYTALGCIPRRCDVHIKYVSLLELCVLSPVLFATSLVDDDL